LLSEELRELYRDVIVDHQRHPQNFRELPDATHAAHGHNPLCGDRIIVFLKLADDTIEDISFQGAGCAISMASASIMTELLQGKTLAETQALSQNLHRQVTGNAGDGNPVPEEIRALSGVHEFPVRVKCATLAWHTLQAALDNVSNTVSTETEVQP
jgi:nitrogen fixation NifU-like protein